MEQPDDLLDHELDVGAVVFVHRRIHVTQQSRRPPRRVGREPQRPFWRPLRTSASKPGSKSGGRPAESVITETSGS
jgi:hypothetical protein